MLHCGLLRKAKEDGLLSGKRGHSIKESGKYYLFKWIMREKEPDYLKHDSDPEKNKRKNAIKKFSRLLD